MYQKISEISVGEEVCIHGFVERFRDLKYVQFIVLSDISGSVQIAIDKSLSSHLVQMTPLTTGSTIIVRGVVESNPRVQLGGIEIRPSEIIIETLAEVCPISSDSSPEIRYDYRWIDLRSVEKRFIFQVQTNAIEYLRRYLLDRDFIEIHTPKLSPISSEGGSEVFKTDYFGQEVYLTQSPQLYKQMAIASGFDRVFEIGDCFRAEKSFTSKHLTEFVSFDVEMAGIESHEDIMKLEEEMLCYMIGKLKDKYGEQIRKLYNIDLVVPTLPFPRVKMKEVYDILSKADFDIEEGEDLSTEMEKYLGKYMFEKTGHEFFFVTDYPSEIRAFYHQRYAGTKIAKGYDLYFKGIEITTGAQREHRYDVLKSQMIDKHVNPDALTQYLDFFKYGCPAHGGFAIGVERLTMLLLGLASVKESAFIARTPNKMKP